MIVYTYLSNTTKYLAMQVWAIKKYLPDCEKIVCITGPFDKPRFSGEIIYPKKNDVKNFEFCVVPTLGQNNRFTVFDYVKKNHYDETKDALFIDGDCFPVMEMEKEDLFDEAIRYYKSFRFLSIPAGKPWEVYRHSLDCGEDVVRMDYDHDGRHDKVPRSIIEAAEKDNKIKWTHLPEWIDPGFIHMCDMDKISSRRPQAFQIEAIEKYLREHHGYNGEYEDELCSTDSKELRGLVGNQSFFSLTVRYAQELKKWAGSGAKLRSPEKIKLLYDVCKDCPFYEHIKKGHGRCTSCGCHVKEDSRNTGNKLALATTACPEGYWGTEEKFKALEVRARKRSCKKTKKRVKG